MTSVLESELRLSNPPATDKLAEHVAFVTGAGGVAGSARRSMAHSLVNVSSVVERTRQHRPGELRRVEVGAVRADQDACKEAAYQLAKSGKEHRRRNRPDDQPNSTRSPGFACCAPAILTRITSRRAGGRATSSPEQMVSIGLLAALSARLLLADTLTANWRTLRSYQRMPPRSAQPLGYPVCRSTPDAGDGGLTFDGARKPLRTDSCALARRSTSNGTKSRMELRSNRMSAASTAGRRNVARREVRVSLG